MQKVVLPLLTLIYTLTHAIIHIHLLHTHIQISSNALPQIYQAQIEHNFELEREGESYIEREKQTPR